MDVGHLRQILDSRGDSPLHIMLPSGEFVPSHFHVTEVGRVQRTFIDCGGTLRETVSCLLQVWTANDVEHRLAAGKLLKILNIAEPILGAAGIPVEIEYGPEVASHYFLSDIEVTPGGLLLVLAAKQTECLAPDKCGVSCAPGSGCC